MNIKKLNELVASIKKENDDLTEELKDIQDNNKSYLEAIALKKELVEIREKNKFLKHALKNAKEVLKDEV